MGWCKFHLFIALLKFSHILAGCVKQQQVKVLQVGDKSVKIHDKVVDRPNSVLKLLSRVEQFRLFSKAEKAGLLSTAENFGLSLSSIEKFIQDYGVLHQLQLTEIPWLLFFQLLFFFW
jgi:ATP-dependent Zn protease